MDEPLDKPGRGRPRSGQTDRAILDATWAILESEGAEGLGFTAIAERAGCGKAAIYRRYANMEELLADIMHATSRAIEPAITDAMSPRDVILAHTRTARDYMLEKGSGLVELGRLGLRNPLLGARLAEHAAHESQFFLEPLRQLAPEGCSPRRLELAFQAIVGPIYQLCCYAKQNVTDPEVTLLVDSAIAMMAQPSDR